MVITLTTGTTYDLTCKDDRCRLNQYIPTLRRRKKTDELSAICAQIESETMVDSTVLETYRKAKNTHTKVVEFATGYYTPTATEKYHTNNRYSFINGQFYRLPMAEDDASVVYALIDKYVYERQRNERNSDVCLNLRRAINKFIPGAIRKSDIELRKILTTHETASGTYYGDCLSDDSDSEAVKDEFSNKTLITDIHLFPRSEYYTRFHGTTAFAMNEPAYWGTYHRSESSRFFSIAGSRKNAQFSSPCVKKATGTHSFYAHTGGFHSPFTVSEYSDAFKLEKQVPEGRVNVRDHLLLYKNRMAKVVVASFARLEANEQKMGMYNVRRIVYTENNYPCVLINLPVLNPVAVKTEATRYWAKHPKPFQRLLLCSFIALLNVEAMRANIPIEMVLRASFGHNLPSVCETNNTFRINVGVIPKCYAELIGKALHLLNQSINAITDKSSPTAPFDVKFLAQVRHYNATKLKEKIKKNDRYKTLRGTGDFQEAELSDAAFEGLYSQFCSANKEKGTKGSSRFQPVILKGKTIWQVIRQAGDSMGKSVLDECFRQEGTEDWFANQVMEALLAGSTNPIETALSELLKCITYNAKVTMNYKKIHNDLNKPKKSFASLSFKRFYKDDSDFSEITNILFDGLCAARPNNALYSELEHAGTNLFITAKGNQIVQEAPDYGSDSEFEDELTDEEMPKRSHISHRKLRVCAGMKAILLAQYGALSYFHTQGITRYRQNIQQMYYEVEDALKLVDINQPVINKVRSTMGSNILHFDLNHCNATNSADNRTLKEKLAVFNSAIVILDYTSATTLAVKEALRQCFSRENVKLVMLVDSGLKNNQGGLDINPYGEVRICARNRKIVKTVSDMVRTGLSKQDKLMPKAHEKIRACKRRGLAFSLFGLFKTD